MPSFYSYGFRSEFDLNAARRKANENLEYVMSGRCRRELELIRDAERNRKKAAREASKTRRERIREIKLQLRVLRREIEEITPIWTELMDLYEKHGTDMNEHSEYSYGSLEEVDHMRDTKFEKIDRLESELADLKWEY